MPNIVLYISAYAITFTCISLLYALALFVAWGRSYFTKLTITTSMIPSMYHVQNTVNVSAVRSMIVLRSYIHSDLTTMGIDVDALLVWKGEKKEEYKTVVVDGCTGVVHVR